jgi:two-component system OmpR family sensor kinase
MEVVRYVVVALALLVPIALWSRSHWQGLQMLARVADEFGAGKLSARAHMKPSDAAYPLAERINAMAERIQGCWSRRRTCCTRSRTNCARRSRGWNSRSNCWGPEALRRPEVGEAHRGDARRPGRAERAGERTALDEQAGQRAPSRSAPCSRSSRCCANAPTACIRVPPPCIRARRQAGQLDGDRRLLARAVGNLLRNAQKYAAHTVALSARRDGGLLEILVDDDGPGIPEEERERIFEPFYRLDRSRDRATGGFGLGLSIARKAVAARRHAARGALAAGWGALRDQPLPTGVPGCQNRRVAALAPAYFALHRRLWPPYFERPGRRRSAAWPGTFPADCSSSGCRGPSTARSCICRRR